MITVAEAQAKIDALIEPVSTERIVLAQAAGRVLRQPVVAMRNQPPFAASAMDGYAIRKSDLKVGAQLQVIGEVAAGHGVPLTIGRLEAARIFTGAPIPDGADFVLIQEDAERNGQAITVKDGFDHKDYIRPAGTDFAKGFEMSAPKRLEPFDMALLASLGAAELDVARKPTVAVIATGDELVWPGQTPGMDQIYASNNFGLKAMLEGCGARVQLLPIASDTVESLVSVLDLAKSADLIVTLGGASVGDHDLVQEAARLGGLDLAFYKLAMRPGKPLMAGKLGNTPMIGLPGNPVSSLVCGQIFLKPAISKFLGLGYATEDVLSARLTRDIGPNGPRAHYMRANCVLHEGHWQCTPFERQDSSLLTVLNKANALMIRPAHQKALKAGSVVEFTQL